MKFVRVFDTEEYGQILVRKDLLDLEDYEKIKKGNKSAIRECIRVITMIDESFLDFAVMAHQGCLDMLFLDMTPKFAIELVEQSLAESRLNRAKERHGPQSSDRLNERARISFKELIDQLIKDSANSKSDD